MCSINDCFIIESGYWIDKANNRFKRKEFLPQKLIRSVILKRNNCGIFQTAYRYNIEDQDKAYLYGGLYLDFDSTEFEQARKDAIKTVSYLKIVFNLSYPDEQLRIYFSGNKGFHIIVPGEVLGVQPRNDLNEVFKTIALTIDKYIDNGTLDLQIYDKKRLFRIENSEHEKTGLYKIELTLEELRNLTEVEIKNLAKSPRSMENRDYILSIEANKMLQTFIERTSVRLNDFKNIKSDGTLKYTPPCILKILDEGAKQGQRNNTIATLASFFKSNGKDLKEAAEIIEIWNNEKLSGPVGISELKKTVRSIYCTEKSYGCSSIKAMSLCVSEKCRFKKS